MSETCVALLGRRDEPTDAIEEYCVWLGRALAPLGISLELSRVPWARKGWRSALADLRKHAPKWSGRWIFVQYTALAWSARGFPTNVPRLLRMLRKAQARCAVVFHDADAYSGSRPVDRLRRASQLRVMRAACELAERVVLTVPVEKLAWLPRNLTKAAFIPVGANLPEPPGELLREPRPAGAPPSVAVFGVTGGPSLEREAADIAFAVNRAAASLPGGLRLVVLGRNSEEARPALERALDRSRVALETPGILPAPGVVRALATADVFLFARGPLSSRRGSAIAGIVCGLPLVAYEGPETAPPVTEAGVLLAPAGNREALAAALERVLKDETLRASLGERSRSAAKRHFAWPVIAQRYAELIRSGG
jgi:glycosyltransferase involved in cell wall biosynthesis